MKGAVVFEAWLKSWFGAIFVAFVLTFSCAPLLFLPFRFNLMIPPTPLTDTHPVVLNMPRRTPPAATPRAMAPRVATPQAVSRPPSPLPELPNSPAKTEPKPQPEKSPLQKTPPSVPAAKRPIALCELPTEPSETPDGGKTPKASAPSPTKTAGLPGIDTTPPLVDTLPPTQMVNVPATAVLPDGSHAPRAEERNPEKCAEGEGRDTGIVHHLSNQTEPHACAPSAHVQTSPAAMQPRAHRGRWFKDGKEPQERRTNTPKQALAMLPFSAPAPKTHVFYKQRVNLTAHGEKQGLLSQDLSVLPATLLQASAAELNFFADKVHTSLARYLDEHNFYVYSPTRVRAHIGFDLIAKKGIIIAYVLTQTSGNPEFDAALGAVVQQLGDDLLAPQTEQAVAFPFMYTIQFEQGLLRYCVSNDMFAYR